MRQIEHGPGDCGTSFHLRRTGFPVGGLTLEERKVRSLERVAAAQGAAIEQEQLPEMHINIMGNPRANHPDYLIRRKKRTNSFRSSLAEAWV